MINMMGTKQSYRVDYVILTHFLLPLLATLYLSACSSVKSSEKRISSDSSVQDNWKSIVHEAVRKTDHKAAGKDELVECPLDDYYDLVEGESFPRKRNAYTRAGEPYVVVGADFSNLRERIPGTYIRYFYNGIAEDGTQEYLASLYIDTLTKAIYLEDRNAGIMDLRTGKPVTVVDTETDPLAHYKSKKITEANAGKEVLTVLRYLKIIDQSEDYQTQVKIPAWEKTPEWWEEYKDTLYDGYFSVVVRDKQGKLCGYYIISKDGRQVQEYSKRNDSYLIIYGTRIPTNTLSRE